MHLEDRTLIALRSQKGQRHADILGKVVVNFLKVKCEVV